MPIHAFVLTVVLGLGLGMAFGATPAGAVEPTMPLDQALNSSWEGRVHCVNKHNFEWTERWNLKDGKTHWINASGGQRDVAWNGQELIIEGGRGQAFVSGTGHFDGDALVADFAYGILQCHAKFLMKQ